MGNFDYKNICLQIKTRENFTDPRFVEFMKDWNFTEKEYDIFLDTVWDSMSNKYSKKIVDFLLVIRMEFCYLIDVVHTNR